MAKRYGEKQKLLYILKILTERTDAEHCISVPRLIEVLNEYGIEAERKSVYRDLEELEEFGYDIIHGRGGCCFASRDFELAELKLLVDSIQAAKFITAKKSNQLIKKIEGLASRYEASQLQRQVYVSERIKTMNESIYYNVDKIHTAIGSNSKITFQYFQWDVHKKMVLRRNGELYEVSPWALSWSDDNYYLVAFDSAEKKIKHFRVDKMLNIDRKEEKREGKEQFGEFNMAVYARKMFGMFSGEEQLVKLECVNELAGVIIDRFGKEVSIKQVDREHFAVNVRVAVSRQFLAWVMALGEGARVVEPQAVVCQMKKEAKRLMQQYNK